MRPTTESTAPRDLALATVGEGPLLQRDYWAVVVRPRLRPSEIGHLLRTRFCELSPPELAAFERLGDATRPLAVGDELSVRIRWAGTFFVRVIHADAQSVTLATLEGHPEAGRITFGAYRDARGGTIAHIRSRARNASRVRVLGFLTVGEPMQTNTWCDFLDRLSHTVGDGVLGAIQEDTRELPRDEPDECGPTYVAKGD